MSGLSLHYIIGIGKDCIEVLCTIPEIQQWRSNCCMTYLLRFGRRKTLVIENFNNYLLVATRYQVYSYQRRHKSSKLNYVADYASIPTPATENEALVDLYHQDFYHMIAQRLDPMPKRCKEIFWMSRMDHLSNEEIAAKLGISKRTVENQITAALKCLRENHLSLKQHVFLTVLASITMLYS